MRVSLKNFLFVVCIVLTIITVANSKAAEDLEKAIATVNKAKVVLDKVNAIIVKANPGKIFSQISKVLVFLGPAMMAVSAVMSIVAVFLPKEDSPELKAINAGFDKVNRKLDVITSDIKDLRNIVELSSAKAAYTKCITAIESNFVALQDAQKENTKESFTFFAKHYEMSYELAATNLYDAMTGKLGPFGFNLVNLYSDYVKCNPLLVSKFCTMGMQTISKGLAIEGAYFGTQNLTVKAKLKQEIWEKKMQILAESCEAVIQHCEDNWKISAAQQFRETYKKELTDNNEEFAKKIALALNEVVPQRGWLAVSYDDASGFREHVYLTSYESDKIWDENKKDVTIFSAPYTEQISENAFAELKKKIEEKKKPLTDARDCLLSKWRDSSIKYVNKDLRPVTDYFREVFPSGVIMLSRLINHPGYYSTGNTLYASELHWKCTSKIFRLLMFV